jgi:iron(III) transport system ATP-binding protein
VATRVALEGICKRFGDAEAIRDLSLTFPAGKVTVLLGPSGCGKTTTLRAIAGLELLDAGRIVFGDRVVFDAAAGIHLPPEDRNIGMVFQSYAVWPHLTVRENVAYPLRIRKRSAAMIRRRVDEVLAITGLADLADRNATRLSGGQQQRVALARAVVAEPEVLLLDEPLSNLDARLRDTTRRELARIQAQVGATFIYVTHDQVEALALGDYICVMNEGRIIQMGLPKEVYEHPETLFVAQFIGSANAVEGHMRGGEGGSEAVVDSPWGRFVVAAADRWVLGELVTIVLRPERLRLLGGRTSGAGVVNRIDGVIDELFYLGDAQEVTLRVGDRALRARLDVRAHLTVGAAVSICIDPQDVIVVRSGDGRL